MEKYNYNEAVLEDVKNYINNNFNASDYEDANEAFEALYDELFLADSVTGNGSGSYTFSSWQAEENLCHNMELLSEALQEFGCGSEYLERGAEACDVTIRCYLLSGALSEVLDEIYNQ